MSLGDRRRLEPLSAGPLMLKTNRHLRKHSIQLYHEDENIIVVSKPGGLLTMSTDRERDRTLYSLLLNYVRKGNIKSRQRIFIIHRLDRETTGLLVFARNERVKHTLQAGWSATRKVYHTVVMGQPEQDCGEFSSYLLENKQRNVYSTTSEAGGKLARTTWRVLERGSINSLLELTLHTGRKHQLRVQLADAGFPICGDKRYNPAPAPGSVLALHAASLSFSHPVTGAALEFNSPDPAFFTHLVHRGGRSHRSGGKSGSAPPVSSSSAPPIRKRGVSKRGRKKKK